MLNERFGGHHHGGHHHGGHHHGGHPITDIIIITDTTATTMVMGMVALEEHHL